MTFQPRFDFDAARGAASLASGPEIDADEALMLDLDGYEGPLHVLLELARRQKIDLLEISVTRLAEQFLGFVREARRRRFALAADYLVMASWLAYLKSRLLLPPPRARCARGGLPPRRWPPRSPSTSQSWTPCAARWRRSARGRRRGSTCSPAATRRGRWSTRR